MATSASRSTQVQVVGGGAFTVGLIFVTLKLAGVITWPWWVVLLPFYLGIALLFTLLIAGFAVLGAGFLIVALLGLVSRVISRFNGYPKNRNRRS